MQIQHRREINIATDCAQFRSHRAGDSLHGFGIPKPTQFRRRGPRGERFSKSKSRPPS